MILVCNHILFTIWKPFFDVNLFDNEQPSGLMAGNRGIAKLADIGQCNDH